MACHTKRRCHGDCTTLRKYVTALCSRHDVCLKYKMCPLLYMAHTTSPKHLYGVHTTSTTLLCYTVALSLSVFNVITAALLSLSVSTVRTQRGQCAHMALLASLMCAPWLPVILDAFEALWKRYTSLTGVLC